jgi:hypothetical protein
MDENLFERLKQQAAKYSNSNYVDSSSSSEEEDELMICKTRICMLEKENKELLELIKAQGDAINTLENKLKRSK